ncbi:low molecular weight protein arginine phosphatase [Paenibacillus sp. MBLB4367]|uniref:low molecular weight protein arginine phosphatase n=1 Tax=Paenibacillus sp. MBLB4367 TaxID=3384767 RepID=UPI003907FFBC
MAHRILFVCTGNTCRSPLAEGLLRILAGVKGLPVEVKSAGVAAMDGCSVSAHSASILRDKGFTGSITSQTLTGQLVGWADLILTMTVNHKRSVIQQYPDSADKTFTLKEYAEDDARVLEAVREHGELSAELHMKQALGQPISPQEWGRLRDMADRLPNYDIADPYGGSKAMYEHCAAEIESSLYKLQGRLRAD